jgi:hypothetical protein
MILVLAYSTIIHSLDAKNGQEKRKGFRNVFVCLSLFTAKIMSLSYWLVGYNGTPLEGPHLA